MNKEAIDNIVEKNPKLKGSRKSLERMTPGSFCIHRSWGFGRIKEYDSANNRLIIDFEDKDSHAMDPAFCVDKLEVLEPDNLLAQQQTNPDKIEEMINNKPVELVIEYLSMDPRGQVSSIELEDIFARLLGERFRKWWNNTKKLLIKDPRVSVPVKKNDPYVLREQPLTAEQEVLEEFYANKNPKKKILLAEKLYQLSDSVEEIASDLPRIMEELTDAVREARKLPQADRLHGVWVRNDLGRYLCEDVEVLEPTSKSIILETENLSELVEELPGQYNKRFLDLMSRVYPEEWPEYTMDLLKNSTGKFTGECISFLIDRDCSDMIAQYFEKWLGEQMLKGPVIYWIVKNRNMRRFHKFTKNLITHQLFSAILQAVDAEALHNNGMKRILLADVLSEDNQLIPDLLNEANEEIAKDLANRLMMNQGFEVLTKKSLLARFIKQFPGVQSLISGDASAEAGEQLVVSEESLEARKKEYELIVNEKIPENKQAIATAREHGDLRENAEYKMARQDQDLLLARKSLLEAELARARVTDFADVDMKKVGIGSVVTVGSREGDQVYAIMGAWDSIPEKNIVSYQTPLGQMLLGKTVGESVKTDIGGNTQEWSIKALGRWVDQKEKFPIL